MRRKDGRSGKRPYLSIANVGLRAEDKLFGRLPPAAQTWVEGQAEWILWRRQFRSRDQDQLDATITRGTTASLHPPREKPCAHE